MLFKNSPCLLLMLLLPAFAAAQAAYDDSNLEREKSASVNYSLAATLVPMIAGLLIAQAEAPEVSRVGWWTVGGGLVIGPSTGQFYAGADLEGALCLMVRGVGALMIYNGIAATEEDCGSCGGENHAASLIGWGGVLLVAGTVYSFVDAPIEAGRKREAKMGWSPTLYLASGQARVGGAAWMHF
jgi:hypothetical protein